MRVLGAPTSAAALPCRLQHCTSAPRGAALPNASTNSQLTAGVCAACGAAARRAERCTWRWLPTICWPAARNQEAPQRQAGPSAQPRGQRQRRLQGGTPPAAGHPTHRPGSLPPSPARLPAVLPAGGGPCERRGCSRAACSSVYCMGGGCRAGAVGQRRPNDPVPHTHRTAPPATARAPPAVKLAVAAACMVVCARWGQLRAASLWEVASIASSSGKARRLCPAAVVVAGFGLGSSLPRRHSALRQSQNRRSRCTRLRRPSCCCLTASPACLPQPATWQTCWRRWRTPWRCGTPGPAPWQRPRCRRPPTLKRRRTPRCATVAVELGGHSRAWWSTAQVQQHQLDGECSVIPWPRTHHPPLATNS